MKSKKEIVIIGFVNQSYNSAGTKENVFISLYTEFRVVTNNRITYKNQPYVRTNEGFNTFISEEEAVLKNIKLE